MVVDFAKVSVQEQPLLILQNLDDTPIGVLKAAFNVEADLCYNEISTLTFDLPAFIDGKDTVNYKQTVGMRIVELKNYGRFILIDPKITDDGVKQVKTCTAYSLEYEFTFKKLPLAAGTYNLWNPIATKGTILGMILELMPSWKVGQVDASLIDRYRTFDDEGDQNIYNFMKSDLQESYGCIFTFDTYNRLIHVRDINTQAPLKPVYFSMENLIKKITIDEDTESIITMLNVYGADGVDIRSVNPMGTSSLIELGYFMTRENFSQSVIDKYNNWKATFEAYQRPYFNLTVEEALKTAQLVTEQAALVTLQSELTSLENIQAVTIQAIAQKLKSQSDLNSVNAQIQSKQREITNKEKEIVSIQAQVNSLNSQMLDINKKTSFESFFTAAEYKVVNRYLKEDSISEDSFVVPEVDTYDAVGESRKLSGSTFNITGSNVVLAKNTLGKDIYSASGGTISCSVSGFNLNAALIRASLDYAPNNEFLFTARMNAGTLNGESFPDACISIAGTASSVSSNAVPNASVNGAILEGTTISFRLGSANLYFTRSTTEYEQRSVEWDLFDYATELLQKVAWPSYTFTLDLANFLAITEFKPFKSNLELGSKLYFKQRDGTVLKPILVGVHIPFEDLSKFSIELSSKYNSRFCEFSYEDFYDDVQSMGTTIDSGKWTYNQFVNSGAETSLSKFMKSALDIAKNNIMSSTGQAITWDEAGFRLRKRKDGSETDYEPYQIWMNNSSIMFTTDNWSTANLAIGQIVSEDGFLLSGVIADSLIGKLLAGNSLIIESAKKDGGAAVFRVDGNGASLHNAIFDIYNSNKVQITLNPYSGIAIGKYPVYSGSNYKINETNASFWVDIDGNVHMKGTLHGVNGTFSGELKAATGTFSGALNAATGNFKGVVQASDFLDSSGKSMMSGSKFASDYLDLKGIKITDSSGKVSFEVKKNGDVTIGGTVTGTITMGAGSSINWATVTNINLASNPAYSLASTANTNAINAQSSADSAYSRANIAWNYADNAYTRAQQAYGAADDAYNLAWDNRNTDLNIFNVLTNGGTRFGIFSDSHSGRLYINANYIRSGSIDADIITLGTSSGGFCCARGHDGISFTYGAMMFGAGDPYFIVTNKGCRMQTNSNEFYVTDSGVYSSEEVTIRSDSRLKHSVEYDLERYKDFFFSLRPTQFKYNNGASDRYHTGFIAQDVLAALEDSGISTKDFAGYVEMKVEEANSVDNFVGTRLNLRYGEFIALNTYMIQSAWKEIKRLQEEFATLKENKDGEK